MNVTFDQAEFFLLCKIVLDISECPVYYQDKKPLIIFNVTHLL